MSNGHPASRLILLAIDRERVTKAAEYAKAFADKAFLDSAAQAEADRVRLEEEAAASDKLRIEQEAAQALLDSAAAAEAQAAQEAEAAAAAAALLEQEVAAKAAEKLSLDSAAAAEAQAAADAAAAAAAQEEADAAAKASQVAATGAALDDAGGDGNVDPAAQYAASSIAVNAVAAVQEWVETDDLMDGETLADRLVAYMAGIADGNQDGELDDDEFEVFQSACSAAWDYVSSKGVSEDDCTALFNDWNDDVAQRVRDVLASTLPEGDEAAADEIDSFVFGDSDQEGVFDAVYKKRLVIRDGKKTRINKRVSGSIRLTAAQKVGIRKAQMKSHNATAQMRRARSVRKGKMMGLGA